MEKTAKNLDVTVRPVNEMDAGAIEAIDEEITGKYRPEHWENRISYYIARDPELALVAEIDGDVVGFMFGDLRGWEFGFAEPTGWIEVLGVDPAHQGKSIGKNLAERLTNHFKEKKATRLLTLVDSGDEDIAAFMQSLGMKESPITAYEMSI